MNVQDWAAIVTIFGLPVAVIGLFLVWIQIRNDVKTREVDVLINLANMSGSHDFQKAINHVLSLPSDSKNSDVQLNQDYALNVCVFFELVGSICNSKYASTQLVREFYGKLVVELYDRLDAYINTQREKTHRDKFSHNFELLADEIRNLEIDDLKQNNAAQKGLQK